MSCHEPVSDVRDEPGATSFAGTDASDNNWDKRIAEHLKDIDGRLRRVIDVQTGSIRIQGLTEQESD